MLVLLHFHALGYTPFELAMLFVLYEFMGVVTNLTGGWIAARFGVKSTLTGGLALQVAALLALSALGSDWSKMTAVVYVLAVQGASGVAKDLSKMSAKSAIKLIVPDNSHAQLFKWVAMLTGSKNALKGAGFFLGGFLLATLGFGPALWAMAGCLGVALAATMVLLPSDLGRAKAKTKFTQLFSKSRAINRLSAARVFLFGARDVWFVVGLPVFLYDVLGWRFAEIGAFLALWVIGYGFVQGLAPSMTMCSADGRSSEVRGAQIWVLGLTAVTLVLAAAMQSSVAPTTLLIVGLGVFGFVFAVNSVLHSYLILAFSNSSDVSLNVGFYYMANAAGRLGGTLLSGLAYQWGGLVGCLVTAAALLAAAAVFTLMLGPVVHERTAAAE